MNIYEKAVKQKYPNATIEKQLKRNGEKYFLVRRERKDYIYLASGKTILAAWKNTYKLIENNK
jgi:hypothetical protein